MSAMGRKQTSASPCPWHFDRSPCVWALTIMERSELMNIDTLAGEGTQMKGRFKSSLGDATGDSRLQQDGAADQLSGGMRKGVGAVRDFARRQPVATASAAAVFGFGLLKMLRGQGARI